MQVKMQVKIRPSTIEELQLSYAQPRETDASTGKIGHLRGDFGSNGVEFNSRWFDSDPVQNTATFKSIFDDVVNQLRFDVGVLQGRGAMRAYVAKNGCVQDGKYGVRIDTDEYAFILRCFPEKGDYNFYLNAYLRNKLDYYLDEELTVTSLLSSIRSKGEALVDGQDADTLLADTLETADFEATGLSEGIFRIWENSSDKKSVSDLFFALTDKPFIEFLTECAVMYSKKDLTTKKVEYEDSWNKQDGTTILFFTAPVEWLTREYPDAVSSSISLEFPTAPHLRDYVSVEISPTRYDAENDTYEDYDWETFSLTDEEISALIALAREGGWSEEQEVE